jgi:flagellar motor protein MotB
VDLRLGAGEREGTPWPVLSDIAITIVLVLVVLIVLQFMQTFRERAVNAELSRRQHAVKKMLADSLDPRWQVRVDSLTPDRQRVTFREEVLFETCRANLKAEGFVLLRTVGRVLGRHGSLFEAVHVEGHTDRRPVRGDINCPFPSNWELSSARATRVVSLFSSEELFANELLSATGRAEFHPVDPSALAPNRRVELILQYVRPDIGRTAEPRDR